MDPSLQAEMRAGFGSGEHGLIKVTLSAILGRAMGPPTIYGSTPSRN